MYATAELRTEPLSMSARTALDVRSVLNGRKVGLRQLLSLTGPAVMASVAYVDPGNFATNIQAGARYGYGLLWVVVVASVLAMLFQALSAKLGIVTGKNLAELCREYLPRRSLVWVWLACEAAAMATDLAEFLGGALGVSLFLHLPILVGMVVTMVVTYGILTFQKRGFRPLELMVGTLVALIGVCYLFELALCPVSWTGVGAELLRPRIADKDALFIAVGIVGATLMPHVLFLHSGLTQDRVKPASPRERAKLVRFSNIEVVIALGLAGAINFAMVMMAAGAFHAGHPEVAEIETAYETLTPLLGSAAAAIFLVSLITSGVSSSVVGTLAGQTIMQGFIGWSVPIWVRRLVTMLPSLVIVALGCNVTHALLLSQFVLSLVLPLPMIALVWFTTRSPIMGAHRNTRSLTMIAIAGTVAVVVLDVVGLVQSF